MIHFVQVVHVDPERAAVAGKAFCLMLAVWLAWHFLPEGWAVVSGWIGVVWHTVLTPFSWMAGVCMWLLDAAIGTLRLVATALRLLAAAQAVLLPIWALVAGLCLGADKPEQGSHVWLGFAALDAACIAVFASPLLGGMIALGSLAALCAVLALGVSARSWMGWTATAAVAGISVWCTWRFGLAFGPTFWLPSPVSWTVLALSAAWGQRLQPGGSVREGGALRLLLVAVVLVVATASPFVVDVARAGVLLPGKESSVLPEPDRPVPPRNHRDRVAATAEQSPPVSPRRSDQIHRERRPK